MNPRQHSCTNTWNNNWPLLWAGRRLPGSLKAPPRQQSIATAGLQINSPLAHCAFLNTFVYFCARINTQRTPSCEPCFAGPSPWLHNQQRHVGTRTWRCRNFGKELSNCVILTHAHCVLQHITYHTPSAATVPNVNKGQLQHALQAQWFCQGCWMLERVVKQPGTPGACFTCTCHFSGISQHFLQEHCRQSHISTVAWSTVHCQVCRADNLWQAPGFGWLVFDHRLLS